MLYASITLPLAQASGLAALIKYWAAARLLPSECGGGSQFYSVLPGVAARHRPNDERKREYENKLKEHKLCHLEGHNTEPERLGEIRFNTIAAA
jgi:hypothetical protein